MILKSRHFNSNFPWSLLIKLWIPKFGKYFEFYQQQPNLVENVAGNCLKLPVKQIAIISKTCVKCKKIHVNENAILKYFQISKLIDRQ